MNLLADNTFLVLATFGITWKISLWLLHSFTYVHSDQWVPLLRLGCWCAVCSHLLLSHFCPQLCFEHCAHPYQDPSSLFSLMCLSKGYLVCLGWLVLMYIPQAMQHFLTYLPCQKRSLLCLLAVKVMPGLLDLPFVNLHFENVFTQEWSKLSQSFYMGNILRCFLV